MLVYHAYALSGVVKCIRFIRDEKAARRAEDGALVGVRVSDYALPPPTHTSPPSNTPAPLTLGCFQRT